VTKTSSPSAAASTLTFGPFGDAQAETLFDDDHRAAIASGDLAKTLAGIEGAPWAEWTKDNKPISATKVARMLRAFGVRPDQHWIDGQNVRGYLESDFEDAWARHLPVEVVEGTKAVEPKPKSGQRSYHFGPLYHFPRGRGGRGVEARTNPRHPRRRPRPRPQSSPKPEPKPPDDAERADDDDRPMATLAAGD
jgi:Protein of unknown function (DUF3631)